MFIIIAVLVVAVVFLLGRNRRNDKAVPEETPDVPEESTPGKREREPLSIQGAYQKSWLFSYAEKDAYSKLKPIADELGYTIFAKVRLLDLLEPIKGNKRYKTYFYKVQAKHVDFVLCNDKLVAEWLIELDDSTHDRPDRKERDQFVDEVVTSVGYKIIHTRAITEELKATLAQGR